MARTGQFSRTTGGVIGQPLAMEGVFWFFLESAFLGLFLFGEKRLSPWRHRLCAFLVFLGSWISGFFIIVTNAWMQHPVVYRVLPNGVYEVTSFWGLLTNPWALLQYAHNMSSKVANAISERVLVPSLTVPVVEKLPIISDLGGEPGSRSLPLILGRSRRSVP